jgi:cytochrome c-type biogenesis protein CcmH
MTNIFKIIKIAIIAISIAASSYALSPEEKLQDQKLEDRAMELFLEVRCIVCNGQVIENSDTEFSLAMRKSIRERILTGKTNKEIKQDLIKEFGEDILITPSFTNKYLLFLLPLIFAVILAIKLFKK